MEDQEDQEGQEGQEVESVPEGKMAPAVSGQKDQNMMEVELVEAVEHHSMPS